MIKVLKIILVIGFLALFAVFIYQDFLMPGASECRKLGGRMYLEGGCIRIETVKVPLTLPQQEK